MLTRLSSHIAANYWASGLVYFSAHVAGQVMLISKNKALACELCGRGFRVVLGLGGSWNLSFPGGVTTPISRTWRGKGSFSRLLWKCSSSSSAPITSQPFCSAFCACMYKWHVRPGSHDYRLATCYLIFLFVLLVFNINHEIC